MMRVVGLVLCVVVALVVAVWFIGGVRAANAIEKLGNESWPAGLGTLASVETRVRPQTTNDAAKHLVELAKPLGISFEMGSNRTAEWPMGKAIGEYVRQEHMRADGTIAAAPPEVATFLEEHEAQIDALRDHLLHGHSPAWELDASKGFDAPIPNLLAHMHIMRLLNARALERGRANDVRAWDDLHATWRLTQSLTSRPELISELIVLAMTRSANAIAWKLPPANVPWLAEMQGADHRRLLLAASQYDAWTMWRYGARDLKGVGVKLMMPYYRWMMADMARHQRETAMQLASITTCGFDDGAFDRQRVQKVAKWNIFGNMAMPNVAGAWKRVFRSVAEREATANAMRVARGEAIVEKSACSDGSWTYAGGRLSFSRELPASSPAETPMPLSLAIPARAPRPGV